MYKLKKEDFGNLTNKKYLLDTCIWRDFYEDRFSKINRPLGKYAHDLFMKIIKNKNKKPFPRCNCCFLQSQKEFFQLYPLPIYFHLA